MPDLQPTFLEATATALLVVAVVHTFSTKFFARLSHSDGAHAGLWHLLGEVEAVFGFWALVLVLAIFAADGRAAAVRYLQGRDFTEPMFVFAIMVIAASRPVLHFAGIIVRLAAAALPVDRALATTFVSLSVVPLLGSFITEPAAMTLAALMLRRSVFSGPTTARLKYAIVAVLFVNVSIGGVLTPYAAPPVLMVAAKWHLTIPHMLSTFGWRAALAVFVNAALLVFLFRRQLAAAERRGADAREVPSVPPALVAAHLAFLVAVVAFAHHPAVFLGVFLFFLGTAEAYRRHQDRLVLREGLMVAFFLAGIVTLGGYQSWWLAPLLAKLTPTELYFGATALTAVTDNAALTYLGSLAGETTEAFRYALLAGAVTGGGLTVIANAPNPAGYAILRDRFTDGSISPGWLFLSALAPTAVAIVAFGSGMP